MPDNCGNKKQITAHILTHHSRESTGVTNSINNGSVHSSVPVSHGREPAQDPEIKAVTWNSAVINVVLHE